MSSKSSLKSVVFTLTILGLVIVYAYFKQDFIAILNGVMGLFFMAIFVHTVVKDVLYYRIPKVRVDAIIQKTDDTPIDLLNTTVYTYQYQGFESVYTCSDLEIKNHLNQPRVSLEIEKEHPSSIRIYNPKFLIKKYIFMSIWFLLTIWLLFGSIQHILA
ncbi:hypothetical protein [Paracholeplasma manati]|uniref:DUF3592 domain-containing protein n=1 Tax=Paracholeplasma manati TaxID=591373 RepID=A0ABT2Y7X6_9MOLU|nr:hypothetical protein [Paracholeplasma manati]MCV2232588.1 hypothetical protein [Paracholeplasma manati]MDG0889081.1 hypothetical protein [Paracholeplasma manati]